MDILTQIFQWISSLGSSASIEMKIAGFIVLLMGLLNSSFASAYLASLNAKLGKMAILLAPVLGVLVAFLQLPGFTGASIAAGLHGGALSLALIVLLEAAKSIPGLGAAYVSVINWIEKLLGAPAAAPTLVASLVKPK